MAVRFDAAADRLVRTSGLLNYNNAYTWMSWIYFTSDTNTNVGILSLDDNNLAALNIDGVGTAADGTTSVASVAFNGVSTAPSGPAFSTGTWYHVAIVRATASSFLVYINGNQEISDTRAIGTRNAATRMEMGGITASNVFRFDGRVASVKAWDTSLTQTEIQAEMAQVFPVRTSNLWGFWPTGNGTGERARDYTTNARHWTESGTLTDEAGPTSVIWGDPLIGTARSSTNVTSLAPTVDQAVPTGQLVVVVLSYRAVGGTPSVTDARGNTYTLDAQASGTNSNRLAIFSAPVTTALQVGDAITASFASSNAAIQVFRFSGLDTTGTRVAASNTALGSSTDISVGATPTASGQVVIAANSRTGNPGDSSFDTDTTDGGWTWIPQTSSGAIQSIEATLDSAVKTVTGTTAQTWNNTLTTSRVWQAAIVVYKVAASSTPVSATDTHQVAATDATITQAVTATFTDTQTLTQTETFISNTATLDVATDTHALASTETLISNIATLEIKTDTHTLAITEVASTGASIVLSGDAIEGGVSLTWNDFGVTPETVYFIEASLAGADDWSVVSGPHAYTVTTDDITGLDPVEMDFRVAADRGA